MNKAPTALIADDEPLLREALARQLAQAWPALEIVAFAHNGREAIRQFDACRPDICFLDVHMPGLNGVDAAHHIARRAHLVFVTAYDHYAVQAFAEGALDYLVKPVDPARLADTVARLQERLRSATPSALSEEVLRQLVSKLQPSAPAPLRWIRATIGQALHLIAVDDIDFLRSDDKYTLVAWRDDRGRPSEALVRMSLKELIEQLDPALFVQVHRSAVVNLRSVSHVRRGMNETAEIFLKSRPEVLKASRAYLHHFRQM